MRPVVGGLYAGKAFVGSGAVVAILDAGTMQRVRLLIVGRYVCRHFEAPSGVCLWRLGGRSDAEERLLRHDV